MWLCGCCFQLGYDNMCVRVSPVTKTFADSRHRCQAEGGDLIPILNEDMQEKVVDFVNRKKGQYEFYAERQFYWIGAKTDDQGNFHWLSHHQNFDDYTNWADPSEEDTKISPPLTLVSH